VHGIDVFSRLRCVDAGNVVFPPFDRVAMRAAVEAQVAALPALPFVVGAVGSRSGTGRSPSPTSISAARRRGATTIITARRCATRSRKA
jgi:hypothetical protein